jgi:hypothetical protein
MQISQEEQKRNRRSEYMRKRRAEYKDEYREYARCRQHKLRSEHREEYNEGKRIYKNQDLNRFGRRKSTIRTQSNKYLYSKHSRLNEYEIHHCFGYEDFKKFIYIPKELHLQIHKLLRDRKISPDSDHWMAIRELVNSCEQYTYISEG